MYFFTLINHHDIVVNRYYGNRKGESMIKIFKSELDKINLSEQIEKDCWIDLINPTKEEVQKIKAICGIDDSVIMQVLVEKEFPRVKKINGGILVVIDVPYMKDRSIKNKYVTYPLGIIICDNHIMLTVSLVEHEFLKKFKLGEVENFDITKRERFLLQIIFNSAEAYLYTLDSLENDIQKVEKHTYHSTNNKQLLNFLNIQKSLVYFITSLRANSSVLERLQKEDIISLNKEEKLLLEDVIIENKQCIENCAISREILSSTIDAYGTIISNNLNVIVKFLTAITIVFSIPTMIASFLGMNVPLGIVGESDLSFLFIFIISFIVSLVLAWWLRKRNML